MTAVGCSRGAAQSGRQAEHQAGVRSFTTATGLGLREDKALIANSSSRVAGVSPRFQLSCSKLTSMRWQRRLSAWRHRNVVRNGGTESAVTEAWSLATTPRPA